MQTTKASSQQANLMHEALDKLLHQIETQQISTPSCELDAHTVTLRRRYSPQTGMHVHAHANVILRFDVSIADKSVREKSYEQTVC